MYREIQPSEIGENVFKAVGADWMLITAGSLESFNTMTASWGGLGVIWGRNICWCVIRPNRYTYEFMEAADVFTLSFFEEKYREALKYCGSNSGRDVDKAKATGLTPVRGVLEGTTCFDEAKLVLECRKIYFQDIDPGHFLDPAIENNYPNRDYHRMYIGEIMNCRVK